MDNHNQRNDRERARLQALVGRVSDEDLGRELFPGGTIASVLAHLAFWDARAIGLIDRWQTRPPSVSDQEPEEVDWINDSAAALAKALEPRRAAELGLELAIEADARVAALSAATLKGNQQAGGPLNVARAEHRAEHLDEIEAFLKRQP